MIRQLTDYEIGELLKISLPRDALLGLFCPQHLELSLLDKLEDNGCERILLRDKHLQISGYCLIGKLSYRIVISSIFTSLSCLHCVIGRLLPTKVIRLVSAFLYQITRRKIWSINTIEILWIVVSPSFRQKGTGTELIQICKQRARIKGMNIYVKTLETTPGNVIFYKKQGFQVVQRRLGRVELLWREYS